MLWSSSMRDTRNAALIAVETKRAGNPDRKERLNRIVVSSSLTVILQEGGQKISKNDRNKLLEKRSSQILCV